MSIYEQNLSIIKKRFPDVYARLENSEGQNVLQVCVGDALDEEKFLAVVQGEKIVALNSSYHPSNEALRYVAQYEGEETTTNLVLFGFSNGLVIEALLMEECPINRCIVYEPSVDILKKSLEEYDLTNILDNPQFILFVEDSQNPNALEIYLNKIINYRNWMHFSFGELSRYKDLFSEEYVRTMKLFWSVKNNFQASMNTLVIHAKKFLQNEIQSLKGMIDCKVLDPLKGNIPEEIPCIIVAAGPSLEKNVEELRRAKGKAFILCVDAAVNFLLERGIEPDMMCTVDPVKGIRHFRHPDVKKIPLALETASNSAILDALEGIQTVYFETTTGYYERLFRERGADIHYEESGGSVATVAFRLAVKLGFKTIVLIGQDLAFTGDKAHAGKGSIKESDFLGTAVLVDEYYGGKVLTRFDYKCYIDWYNLYIPKFEGITVINATEGGAKLKAAKQMPLAEVVDIYCAHDKNVSMLLDMMVKPWETQEDKLEFYQEVKRMYQYYNGFKRRVKNSLSDVERGITLLQREHCSNKELQKIEQSIARITNEVETNEAMSLLIARIIETDMDVEDDLHKAEEDMKQESIRLYRKVQTYLSNLLEAVDELLPTWKQVIEYINQKYHFE